MTDEFWAMRPRVFVRKGGDRSARLYMRYRIVGQKEVRKPLGVADRSVAAKMVREFAEAEEREHYGVGVSRSLRAAALRELSGHLKDYIGDLRAMGRDRMYWYTMEKRLTRLLAECGWKVVKDVTADSFSVWRQRQKLSPVTLNQYLESARGFLNWMISVKRLENNSLLGVEKASEKGRDQKRRALLVDEVRRLLALPGDRRLVYLVAITTGMRRAELAGLRWGSVSLDVEVPFVTIEASTSKNGLKNNQPLHPDAVSLLRAARPAGVSGREFVFSRDGVPKMDVFREDLKAAGISEFDSRGYRVVFHSLRHTFVTMLQSLQVGRGVAQVLARHSDSRLTEKVYTDEVALPLAAAVCSLPRLVMDGGSGLSPSVGSVGLSSAHISPDVGEEGAGVDSGDELVGVGSGLAGCSVLASGEVGEGSGTRGGTQEFVQSCPEVSFGVTVIPSGISEKVVKTAGKSGVFVSFEGGKGEEPKNWGTRIRT